MKIITANYKKRENSLTIQVPLSLCLPSSILESLEIYSAVKILVAVTFGLL